MRETVSNDNKEVARITGEAFGGDWSVQQYLRDSGDEKIDILRAVDKPSAGLVSLSTVGLSDYHLPGTDPLPVGSEITACSNTEDFAHVLATSAYYVMNSNWLPKPGKVFGDVVSLYFEGTTTPHLYLVNPPWAWDGLHARKLTQKTVGWLMALPITESERVFLAERGEEEFEDLFIEKDPDFIDLRRESII